ncbi:hypothetical protein DFH27DRAFT_617042 [Peziza echinospora]|nr:hypothetical protein DFH27DRAFT_617042 [Peziza echinospora]
MNQPATLDLAYEEATTILPTIYAANALLSMVEFQGLSNSLEKNLSHKRQNEAKAADISAPGPVALAVKPDGFLSNSPITLGEVLIMVPIWAVSPYLPVNQMMQYILAHITCPSPKEHE